MPTIIVTTREGVASDIAGTTGQSVMENIRDAGIDELLALCGGTCSCATCHVYVDESFLGRLPAMQDDEDELLESSDSRRLNSRLSCQIPYTDALDALPIRSRSHPRLERACRSSPSTCCRAATARRRPR